MKKINCANQRTIVVSKLAQQLFLMRFIKSKSTQTEIHGEHSRHRRFYRLIKGRKFQFGGKQSHVPQMQVLYKVFVTLHPSIFNSYYFKFLIINSYYMFSQLPNNKKWSFVNKLSRPFYLTNIKYLIHLFVRQQCYCFAYIVFVL